MAQGPYQTRLAPFLQCLGHNPTGTVQLELTDTPNIYAQREVLHVRTQVSPPYPNHPQAVELVALLRVRSLLDAQIQAMQSP
jgi:hypothetical protein